MTRHKKSRKPGVGSSGIRKADIKEQQAQKEKRLRKKTGLPSGNRTQVSKKKSDNGNGSTNKDPRIGSKAPILLGKADIKKASPTKIKLNSAITPLAKVRAVEPNIDIQAEIESIEQDSWLLDIVEKQEQGQSLSEQEIAHYNSLMEKHQALSVLLPDDESEEDAADEPLSEDDLWDKFNDLDINEFEEEDH